MIVDSHAYLESVASQPSDLQNYRGPAIRWLVQISLIRLSWYWIIYYGFDLIPTLSLPLCSVKNRTQGGSSARLPVDIHVPDAMDGQHRLQIIESTARIISRLKLLIKADEYNRMPGVCIRVVGFDKGVLSIPSVPAWNKPAKYRRSNYFGPYTWCSNPPIKFELQGRSSLSCALRERQILSSDLYIWALSARRRISYHQMIPRTNSELSWWCSFIIRFASS